MTPAALEACTVGQLNAMHRVTAARAAALDKK